MRSTSPHVRPTQARPRLNKNRPATEKKTPPVMYVTRYEHVHAGPCRKPVDDDGRGSEIKREPKLRYHAAFEPSTNRHCTVSVLQPARLTSLPRLISCHLWSKDSQIRDPQPRLRWTQRDRGNKIGQTISNSIQRRPCWALNFTKSLDFAAQWTRDPATWTTMGPNLEKEAPTSHRQSARRHPMSEGGFGIGSHLQNIQYGPKRSYKQQGPRPGPTGHGFDDGNKPKTKTNRKINR